MGEFRRARKRLYVFLHTPCVANPMKRLIENIVYRDKEGGTAVHGVDSLTRTSPLIAGTTLWVMADDPGNPPKETLLSGPALPSGETKSVGLLVEDNLADVLLVQDAIEYYNLPVELYVIDDGDAACLVGNVGGGPLGHERLLGACRVNGASAPVDRDYTERTPRFVNR